MFFEALLQSISSRIQQVYCFSDFLLFLISPSLVQSLFQYQFQLKDRKSFFSCPRQMRLSQTCRNTLINTQEAQPHSATDVLNQHTHATHYKNRLQNSAYDQCIWTMLLYIEAINSFFFILLPQWGIRKKDSTGLH